MLTHVHTAQPANAPHSRQPDQSDSGKNSYSSSASPYSLISAKEAAGGYYDKGRGDFRAEGGVLATGGKRTCLPEAEGGAILASAFPGFGPKLAGTANRLRSERSENAF